MLSAHYNTITCPATYPKPNPLFLYSINQHRYCTVKYSIFDKSGVWLTPAD